MADEIDSIPQIPSNASAIRPGTLDRIGRPFDPAKHLARQHPRSGAWMPKGGRKALTATPAPAVSAPAAAAGPVSADPTEALGRAMAADMPPVSGATTQPAAAENISGPGTPEKKTSGAQAPAGPFIAPEPRAAAAVDLDATDRTPPALSPEATGELAARALYGVTGAFLGDHTKATATGAEHANIKAAGAAYARSVDLKIVGGLALVLTVLAYLIDDKRRGNVIDRIRALLTPKKPAPIHAPAVEIEPAPAPVPAAPAEPVFVEKY